MTRGDRPARLKATGVSRRYRRSGGGDVVALDAADFEAQGGELVLIMGPSGSGKSTLLAIIGLLDPADDGAVFLNGIDVTRAGEDERARLRRTHLGFLFQDAGLIDRKPILDNTALPLIYRGVPRRERENRAQAALEAVGLADRMHHAPGELSGGERQRAGLARAIVCNPDILICDEPTAALDAATAQDVARRISEMKERGAAVILATHDRDLVPLADRIYEMRHGRITEAGAPT
ncbi:MULTISPECIES: ABC transporter ATP-binding protein [Hyphobacterium]|uniref:ABC transporter ATP-binding protein n=1 Tax=Hyphobacterium vulgare TaxID=1736751 RepID=A0ABV6ZWH1_9PROT